MNHFDEDYYLRGPQTGKSNYEDYSWKPDLTIAYAISLCLNLRITSSDSVLDFGCARGYLVKALRILGIMADGCDISEWAIQNADNSVRSFLYNGHKAIGNYDWVHAKDVLEHIPEIELTNTVKEILDMSIQGAFFIVPLTDVRDQSYIYPADNKDPSHQIRWTMSDWMRFLTIIADSQSTESHRFVVEGSYHIDGLKKASVTHRFSTGFFTITKRPAPIIEQ